MTKALQKRLMNMCHDPLASSILNGKRSDTVFYLGISTNDPNKISYIDKSKLENCGPIGKWHAKNRISIRPGRLARKIFEDDRLSDDYYENFSNAFITSGTPAANNNTFKIVEKEDIKKYYHWKAISCESGSLGSSCMRGDTQQNFLDIYCNNPDHVKLAVMLDDKGVLARCLIWYPNGDKSLVYFDRIYSSDSTTELQMYQWLVNKKYVQISDKNTIKPTKKVEIRIKLKNLDFKYYPYVDTIRYINKEDINNLEDGDSLHHTDGRRKEPVRCPYSRNIFDSDESFVEIVAGSWRNNRVCPESAIYSEVYNGYILRDESYSCSYQNQPVLIDDLVRLHDGDHCYKRYSELRKDIIGKYFIEGDCEFVKIDDLWYYINSSAIELIDGTYKLKQVEPKVEPKLDTVESVNSKYSGWKAIFDRWLLEDSDNLSPPTYIDNPYTYTGINSFYQSLTDLITENVSNISSTETDNSSNQTQDITF